MDEKLKERLENSKKIRDKLIKEGFTFAITWEEQERAMIYNWNVLKNIKNS